MDIFLEREAENIISKLMKYNASKRMGSKMRQTGSYGKEYKVQAVKLAKTRGTKAAAAEMGIPEGTLSGWVHKAKSGYMDLGHGKQRPETALMPAAENEELRRQLKERDKEIKRLNELNEFLEEASAFLRRGVGCLAASISRIFIESQ